MIAHKHLCTPRFAPENRLEHPLVIIMAASHVAVFKLNDDARRLTPCTVYPLESKNSAKYEPSCPVMPVISAVLVKSLSNV